MRLMVTKMAPSARLSLQLVRIIRRVRPTMITRRKTLLNMSSEIMVGFIMPARPRTPRRLNRSLPIRFPIAMP